MRTRSQAPRRASARRRARAPAPAAALTVVLAGALAGPGAPGRAAAQEPARPAAARLVEIRPDWLSYRADSNLVRLSVTATLNGANGGLNFNGYANGDLTITVPLGWKVVVTFVSRDASIPHSVGIVEPADPIPATSEGLTFAFRGAFSVPFTSGSRAGQTQTFDFVADREGRFWLYCGVPGHGVMGMWTYFVVSREATRPRAEVRQT